MKAKFPPLPDQRKKEDYRASDLLLGKCDLSDGSPSDGSQKTLNIAFTHAYSSLSFPSDSVKVTCTIAGENEHSYSALVRDVSFTIGGEPLLPYLAGDSTYRIVVSPAGSKTSVDCLFGVGGGRMYSKTMDFEGLDDNTLYTLTLSSNMPLDIGNYGLEMARQFDFYCKDPKTQKGYLIPGDAGGDIIDAHKEACLGIVFWAGDVTGDNYGLLATNNEVFSNGTHGLVVSLWDLECPEPQTDNETEKQMKWTYDSFESIQSWLNNNTDCTWNDKPVGFNIRAEDRKQGYVNTLALQAYNDYVVNTSTDGYGSNSGYRVKPIVALEEFKKKHPAPSNSSDWYWPSVYELRYVCSGIWQTGASKDGINLKEILNRKFEKVGETDSFGDDFYWSSTESSSSYNYRAWYVRFANGNVSDDSHKLRSPSRVRPLLAF